MGDGEIVFSVPHGTPKWNRDATPNDSDKSFTVPTGKVWHLKTVYAALIATATVGNRALVVVINNGADNVFISAKTGSIAASNSGTILIGDIAVSGSTANQNPILDTAATPNATVYNGQFPSGGFILPAGYIVRVYDTAAIDAAADDMTVVLHYWECDA